MGADVWALALLRELDDALLYLRFNAPHACNAGAAQRRLDSSTSLQHDAWLARTRVAVVGARNPAASRRRTLKRLDLTSTHAGGAGGTRQLLRRISRRGAVRRRPQLHARRRVRRQRRSRRTFALGRQLRRLADVQWTQPARDALLRRSVGGASAFARSLAIRSMRRPRAPRASSRSRRTKSTGATKSVCCWKSARAFRRTR